MSRWTGSLFQSPSPPKGGPDKVTQQNSKDATATKNPHDTLPARIKLLTAAQNGNITVLEDLLGKGVDPNHFDEELGTPLIIAIKNRHYQAVEALIRSPNTFPNQVDILGQTPLLYLAKIVARDPLEAKLTFLNVRLLLERGDATIDACDQAGTTPLFYASLLGCFELAELLLSFRANPDISNMDSGTPLQNAVANGQVEMVGLLIQYGASVDLTDNSGSPIILKSEDPQIDCMLKGFKTSHTSPIEFHFIDDRNKEVLKSGRIGMSLCPGLVQDNWKRDLKIDLQAFKRAKVDVVVTLLTKSELEAAGIPNLFEALNEAEFMALGYEIPTDGVPEYKDFIPFVRKIVEVLHSGKTIIVHCDNELRRSCLVLVACLIQIGVEPDAGLQAIRSMRKGVLSATVDQTFLQGYQAQMKN